MHRKAIKKRIGKGKEPIQPRLISLRGKLRRESGCWCRKNNWLRTDRPSDHPTDGQTLIYFVVTKKLVTQGIGYHAPAHVNMHRRARVSVAQMQELTCVSARVLLFTLCLSDRQTER